MMATTDRQNTRISSPSSAVRAAIKPFLLLFLLPALLATLLSSLLYQKELSNEKELTLQASALHIAHEKKLIENIFSLLGTDLFLLANESRALGILSGKLSIYKDSDFHKELLTFARFKGIYDQIRLIDANGREQLRINYHDGTARLVPEEELQDKGNRYYFTDTIRLPRNAIYISPFDLNIENGALERPLKPMLRIAMPVVDHQGVKQGIAILNYLGSHLLDALNDQVSGNSEATLLINADGYWLKGLKPEDEWGFMFSDGKEKTIASRFPDVWRVMQQGKEGHIFTQQGLFYFDQIRPFQRMKPKNFSGPLSESERLWHIATFIPAASLFPVSKRLHERLLWINITAIILWAIAAWSLALTSTRSRLAERALIEKEVRIREVVNTAFDGIITVNGDGIIESFNPAASRIFGYREEEVIGRNINLLVPGEYHTLHDAHIEHVKDEDSEKLKRPREMTGKRKDGSIFPMEIGIGIKQKKDGWLFTAIFRDITERKKMQNRLKRMAITDELTGVYNRFFFNARFEQGFKHALRYQQALTLMVLDIDNFKSINDSLGHAAGDTYLTAFARQIAKSCRDTDTVCRYGGEEFVIMLPETDIKNAELLAARLLRGIGELRVAFDGNEIATTVSIGLAAFDSQLVQSSEDLFKLADSALYRAKKGGKNRFVSA